MTHGIDLEITGLTKRYGNATALDGVDLHIAAGEFMTLLGPSGSGKTTTLNIVAGFVEPDAGTVRLGDELLIGVPTYRREIGVVFQHYALFPHMRVAANVGFPLRQRHLPKAEIARKVGEILEIVGLSDLANRYPRELSGGQQQRVALARALVFGPKLLLLDEPLGALDKRLREGLQLEIKRIHRELGVTFVFVTHDQDEALVMSDRIAVFNDGRIEQVAAAHELYQKPSSLFAAQFLGDSNVFEGAVGGSGIDVTILADGLTLKAPVAAGAHGGRVALVIRPEKMRIDPHGHAVGSDSNALVGTITDVVYMGSRSRLLVATDDGRSIMADRMVPSTEFAIDDKVVVSWSAEDATVVDGGMPTTGLGK
jgi:putative spermidine/putrescine transport system ATP-binding protein